jgi:Protein of unknown function (DUF2384)
METLRVESLKESLRACARSHLDQIQCERNRKEIALRVRQATGHQNADAARVLSAAVARIAELWRLSNSGVGAIIGLSEPTISRLRRGHCELDPGSKSFELAQHLLRLFRSLENWLGQDDDAARSWLATRNSDLEASPAELILTVRGLLRTSDYVDGIRART